MRGEAVAPRRVRQHEEASTSTPNSRRILPLSPDAMSQIHSSKHITTLQGVICSLLENSLDAGATKVDITVDSRRGGCSVEDNGAGIPAAEFLENGGLGKMYCTWKRSAATDENGPTHGSTGTFLAELAAMSLLRITSTYGDGTTSSTLTMYHGKVVARHMTTGETTDFANVHQKHSTRVTVRDLFGNMPVRVKQRAHTIETGHDEKAWHELKSTIVALLLAWPSQCTVKLRDSNVGSRTLNLGGGNSSALTEKRLGQLAGRSVRRDPRDVLPVIFQASLAPAESRSKWVPLSASTSVVSLRGMLCVDPAPTKQCQFVAIGIMPCAGGERRHEIYHAVNKIIANSSFGIVEGGASTATADKSGQNTAKHSKAQKGLDRFAMYFLQLSFRDHSPAQYNDFERMSEATMKNLIDVLEAAVHAWLESNHFRPWKRRRRRNNEQQSPASASPVAFNERLSVTGKLPLKPSSSIGTSPPVETASTSVGQRPLEEGASERRRIVNLSTELANDCLPTADALPEDGQWHSLSRARSGLPRTLPESRPPPTTPNSRRCGTAIDPARGETRQNKDANTTAAPVARLRAPSLSMGQLNGYRTVSRPTPPDTTLSSDDFGSVDDEDLLAAAAAPLREACDAVTCEDGKTAWTDPISKQIFQVNSRTGVVLPLVAQDDGTDVLDNFDHGLRQRAAIDTTVSSAGHPISLSRRSALGKSRPATAATEREKWLPSFWSAWKNPVFAKRDEESIPCASVSGPGLVEQLEEDGRGCADDKYHRAFARHGEQPSGGTILSKAALKDAQIIGQVDRKFILAKMPSHRDQRASKSHQDVESTLVLIDQHAASERVILENLLDDAICVASHHPNDVIIQSTSLLHNTTRAKVLAFEISPREHELFDRHRPHFQHWGITYTLPPPTFTSSLTSHTSPGSQSHRLVITHLPTLIAERCSNFPNLTIELLREEAWALADGTRKPHLPKPIHTPYTTSPSSTDAEPTWISILSSMPAKMLAMLHSRACRSAIMFNDPLSKQECEDLVAELGECVFPFVCAHGRVGMVPVVDLGRAGDGMGLEMGWRASTVGIGSGVEVGVDVVQQELGYEREWDGREEGVEMGKLARFMAHTRVADEAPGKVVNEEEEMVEASPHQFER